MAQKWNMSRREAERSGQPRVAIESNKKGLGSVKGSSSSGYGGFKYDDSGVKDLQKQLLGSLSPSQEETGIGDQLNQIIQQRDKGVFGEGQRPVELTNMMGQQRGVIESANIMAQPLQQRMESLQNQRNARVQALRESMGFAADDYNRARQAYESDRAFSMQKQQFEYGKQQDALANALKGSRSSGGVSTKASKTYTDELKNALTNIETHQQEGDNKAYGDTREIEMIIADVVNRAKKGGASEADIQKILAGSKTTLNKVKNPKNTLDLDTVANYMGGKHYDPIGSEEDMSTLLRMR